MHTFQPTLSQINHSLYLDDLFVLRWRIDKGPKKKGQLAGRISTYGYIQIRLDYVLYEAHRLIYQIIHELDEIPNGQYIDHIDGNPINNNPINLRLSGHSENLCNRSLQTNNKSGYKGISWDKSKNKWIAQLQFKKKHYFIGRYNSENEAYLAWYERAKKIHGEFFHP